MMAPICKPHANHNHPSDSPRGVHPTRTCRQSLGERPGCPDKHAAVITSRKPAMWKSASPDTSNARPMQIVVTTPPRRQAPRKRKEQQEDGHGRLAHRVEREGDEHEGHVGETNVEASAGAIGPDCVRALTPTVHDPLAPGQIPTVACHQTHAKHGACQQVLCASGAGNGSPMMCLSWSWPKSSLL
ncbi:hypothetical protein FOA52_005556 [Chlamydomonas sp. UWO 241]|nr:hypothetical protein FOA52_005556 [Chlamydomonas sp. UWO 241]